MQADRYPIHASFVGLATFDLVYLLQQPLGSNEKQRATRFVTACGGPAANAAVTFNALGGKASLLTCLGQGPFADSARTELAHHGVRLTDATGDSTGFPVSSVLVQHRTGDRAVVSLNDGGLVADPARVDIADGLRDARCLLIDGHHPQLALVAAREASRQRIPVVLDAGSWKPTTDSLLSNVDIAVCSDDFSAPGVPRGEVLDFLLDRGISQVAISRGPEPILWRSARAGGEVHVPDTKVVDTSGAGDILHGAFTFAIARTAGDGGPISDSCFVEALTFGARVASLSCQYFGTREWITRVTESGLT